MSQGADKKLRRRFAIKFRDVAVLGRPRYAKAKTGASAARRQQQWLENKRKGLVK